MMIQARDESGNGLTDIDLRHELNTLISAGHETTATALAWGADLLAHNPAVQIRAREAVRRGDQKMKVVIGATLEQFDLLPTQPQLARPIRRGIVLAPKGGGRVRIVGPRGPCHEVAEHGAGRIAIGS
jgi:cytochrome P450 family 135